jgi:hypothetical protein
MHVLPHHNSYYLSHKPLYSRKGSTLAWKSMKAYSLISIIKHSIQSMTHFKLYITKLKKIKAMVFELKIFNSL